uniref:Uncharacterized protein n=1 Tax=Gopherus evgoodei TaxID=1825980 RepID=A0A8C4WPQ7_9SAUR
MRLLEQMLIFSSLSAFQCFHLMILGLNSADNITALYGLHFNELVSTIPTKEFNTENVKMTLCLWWTLSTPKGGRKPTQLHNVTRLSSSTPRHLQPTCAIIRDGLEEELDEVLLTLTFNYFFYWQIML